MPSGGGRPGGGHMVEAPNDMKMRVTFGVCFGISSVLPGIPRC